jgi:hypothetical protein
LVISFQSGFVILHLGQDRVADPADDAVDILGRQGLELMGPGIISQFLGGKIFSDDQQIDVAVQGVDESADQQFITE